VPLLYLFLYGDLGVARSLREFRYLFFLRNSIDAADTKLLETFLAQDPRVSGCSCLTHPVSDQAHRVPSLPGSACEWLARPLRDAFFHPVSPLGAPSAIS